MQHKLTKIIEVYLGFAAEEKRKHVICVCVVHLYNIYFDNGHITLPVQTVDCSYRDDGTYRPPGHAAAVLAVHVEINY